MKTMLINERYDNEFKKSPIPIVTLVILIFSCSKKKIEADILIKTEQFIME